MKVGIVLASVLFLGAQVQAFAYSQEPDAQHQKWQRKVRCPCAHKYSHIRRAPRKHYSAWTASRSVVAQRDDGLNDYQAPASRRWEYSGVANDGYVTAPKEIPPPIPPLPTGSSGAVFNFYGPTNNFFGPTSNFFGLAAQYPHSRQSVDSDRMDPWYGYDPRDGLENGY
jgi:hypothetical protein